MVKRELADGVLLQGEAPAGLVCESCLEGKMHQRPFHPAVKRAKKPLELIHMDLMGPVEVPSVSTKSRYMLTLIDDCTRYAWIYFLKRKSDCAERLKRFYAFVQTQFDCRIRRVRSDRGGEFFNNLLENWYDQQGIVRELSIPETPQQNGVAERYNRTLCDRARSMLFAAGLPTHFWQYALQYANWCTNRIPTASLADGRIPYYALHGRKPNLTMAKVFGSLAHVWVPESLRQKGKFKKRAMYGIFLGIPAESKGWEFYVPDTGVIGFLSRNAFFHEDRFLRDYKASLGHSPVPSVSIPYDASGDEHYDPFPPEVFEVFTRPTAEPDQLMQYDAETPLDTGHIVGPPILEPPLQGVSFAPLPSLVEDVARVGSPRLSEDTPAESIDMHEMHEVEVQQIDAEENSAAELAPREGVNADEHLHRAEVEGDDASSSHSFSSLSDSLVAIDADGALEEGEESGDDDRPIHVGVVPSHSDIGRPRRERRPPLHFSPTHAGDHRLTRGNVEVPRERALRVSSQFSEGSYVGKRPSVAFSPVPGSVSVYRRGHAQPGCAFMVVPKVRWKIPRGVGEANKSEHAPQWLEARCRELGRLEEMGTWELVDPPPDANILPSLWVFALKFKPDNTVDKFKARLVVNGSFEQQGKDYDETFASTAGRTTIRMFLALCCAQGLYIHQMDVTTAFLYGFVDKEIYMRQPPGHYDGTSRVCRLVRSLYGLKQAPRIWSETLRASLLEIGFRQSMLDPSLYYLEKEGQTLYLLDFVDDMLLASASESLIQWGKDQLTERYKMTDMGVAQKYVGIHIHRDMEKGEMWLHQASYCLDLLEKFKLVDKPFPDTPLPADFVLFYPWEVLGAGAVSILPEGKVEEPLLDSAGQKRYQQIVGCLNYAAHVTRPDVAYAVSQLSRATQNPRGRHMAAAERCVCYLAGTADWGLHYMKQAGCYLECYVDANLGSSVDHKSMTGIVLQVAGGPVFWTARKQDRVCSSTCDSESLAIMTAVQYVEHARDTLEEMGQVQMWPTPVFNDNSAAVKLCIDPRSHHKSIQLTRPMAYVRERTDRGIIAPVHVRTTEMPADFFTKRLNPAAFESCRWLCGMLPLPKDLLSL
jgi:hypothetical protein